MYAGDLNTTSSNDASYQTLLATDSPGGVAQGAGFDPINRPGNWDDNTAFQDILSESATDLRYRDDHELITQNILSAAAGGLGYVTGAYHTFGVNGTTPEGGSVNSGSDTALDSDLVQDGPTFIPASTLYSDLTTASDHLPVVADYDLIPADTATALAAAPSPSISGQTVTFTATVTSSAGTPTGTVTFLDGSATLGTASLNDSGVAVFATAALTVGTHTITATYGGDVNFAGSSSSGLTQTVYTAAFWEGYAGNSEHTALSAVAAQPLDAIHWQTPVDLQPQYSGSELFIHYGAPSITPANTVLVPVKTGAGGGFAIDAYNGGTGSLLWSRSTDYQLPPNPGWTPSYAPVLTPQGRYYFAGDGGTVYYSDNPDSSSPTFSQLAFYGVSNYNANPSAYNGKVFINTPLTSDDAGNIYFGFQVTGSNPLNLTSGIARIAPDGTSTWAAASSLVSVASGNPSVSKLVDNSAPAISNDGTTLYIAVNNGNAGVGNYGYVVQLNSTTLAPLANVVLKDPSTGDFAYLPDDGTASVTVGPDGEVYIGVLENPFPHYNDRGWLLQFSPHLSQEGTPGAFGWDDTVSIVPASMIPSYTGSSSYLLMTKYNNYIGIGNGDGENKIAILDPNDSENCPVTGSANMQVMDEVETVLGPTPSPAGGVAEWCINSAAVDPASDSVIAGSEDGKLYRWNLASNTLTQVVTLTAGLGEAYTSTEIGPDGTVYAVNNATLFAVGMSATTVSMTDNGPAPSQYGQVVTFTVTVAGSSPTGTVQLIDSDQNNKVVAYGSLSNGSVTLYADPLPVGNHRLYAVYLGDANNNAAESNQTDQVVAKAATTTTLTDRGPNPSVTSQSVSFTVTVSGGPPISNETVKIEDADNNNAIVATPTLTNGTVNFTLSSLSAALSGANHHLFAVYGGDSSYSSSQSSQVNQVVYTPLTVAEAVNGADVTIAGQSVSLAGAQRSMVDNIVVTFSRAVTLDAAALSLALHANVTVNGTNYADGYGTVPETVSVTNPSGDGETWVVSFSGASVIGQSIADGVYDITLTGSAVHDAAVGQTYAQQAAVAGAQQNVTNTFFRLFGDASGVGTVNNADNRLFRSTYLQSIGDAGYLAYMDYTAAGIVNNAANQAFARRYYVTYSGFTATI